MKVLPVTVLLMGLAAIAAIGLPPFGLFLSELTIISGGLAAHQTTVSVLILVALLASFCGILQQLTRILLGARKPGAPASDARRMDGVPAMALLAGRAADLQRVAARAAAGVAAPGGGHHRRPAMNLSHVSDELRPVVEEINRRFQGRIESCVAPHANEVYFHAGMELVAGFCAHLYRKWNARLVSVFADDARARDGVFHLYYVLALDAAHGFLILRVPVVVRGRRSFRP